MLEKKRGNIKLVLLFFVIAIILASAIFLFLKERTITNTVIEGTASSSPPFKVDQILLKVLIKDDESMARPINIMDISNYDIYIEIEVQNLYDIVSISDNKFALKTGQTKTVYLNFTSFIKEKGIKHEPGIYVGNLLIKSNSDMVKIPIIVEIETKEILFDANAELPIEQKRIEQGGYLNAHINLFNLKKIGLTNLNMEYFIKDIFGNNIITETESITVETQTSFVKTIHIPENLNPGEYILGVVAKYGSSGGTSTLLFEVTKPIAKDESLLDYFKNNRLFFWILLITLIITISAIVSYISLLIYDKSIHPKEKQKIKARKKEEKKLVKQEVKHKEFKHKKLFLVLMGLFIISSITAYLFYSRIVTLEKINYLWSLIINWLKNIAAKILEFEKNIANRIIDFWNNTKPLLFNTYTNLSDRIIQNYQKYSYLILGIIIGSIAITCPIIIAKKTRLLERIFKNFKKEKIMILIILIILFLMVLVSFLIDLGILSVEQLSIRNIAVNIKRIFSSLISWFRNILS